jgi:hypothetical protein
MDMEEVKQSLVTKAATGTHGNGKGPPGGLTTAVPCFQDDLKALVLLTQGEKPLQ